MKKTITLSFLLCSIFCSAQAVLDHSYTTEALSYSADTYSFNTENATYHYTYDSTTNSLKIYTSAHVLYKTVLLPNNGASVQSMVCFSDKLFNSDNLIEFITVTFLANNTYKMTLINENGVTLQEFGARNTAKIIKNIAGNFKLITQGHSLNADGETVDVYSLTGTLSADQFNQLYRTGIAYPNPAEDILNIADFLKAGETTKLEIFSLNGQKVVEKNVTSNSENTVSVDISRLSKGLYIYKINGQQNKFLKK